MRWMVWWTAAVWWAGCAAQAADAVRVTHRVPKATCEDRGQVEGKGSSVTLAQRDAREAAVGLGADTVVLDGPVVRLPAGRSYVSGTALLCRSSGPSPEAPAAQPSVAPAPANALPGVAAAEASAAAAVAAESSTALPATAEQKTAQPEAPSMEQRLRTLQDLHDKGLITQQDYDARRQEILQEL